MEAGFDRAWAEIDLNNIIHNLNEIKARIKNKTQIMAVVKANAYGHGSEQIAGTLIESGVARLAVSTLDEALQLRFKGINIPIQILSHTFPARVKEIIDHNLIQTIFNVELAEELSNEAKRRGARAKVHIKMDTGMNRLGFQAGEETLKKIVEIYKMPCIEIEGIMTHFASSDEIDKKCTEWQIERFIDTCNQLEKTGIHIPIKHTANSAAFLNYPEMQMDMVRPGIIIYGLYPSTKMNRTLINLKPAMSLKARIININYIPENLGISYGSIFKTSRRSCIISLPVGYADGYPTILSNKSRILAAGEYAPIVGRVCMDHCMADVTDIKNKVTVGDEAVFFGKQGYNEVSIDEVAEKSSAINYEVVCRIGMRIPRVYIKDSKVVNVSHYMK